MIKNFTIFISILVLLSYSAFSQAGLNVSSNGTLFISSNAKLRVNGDVLLGNSSQFTQSTGDSIVVTGNWTNNGTMTPNGGVTLFNSGANQTIGGSSESRFYDVSVNKTAGNILLTDDMYVDRNLRLLTNTLVDIADDTLTIGETGAIFTDNNIAVNFTNLRSIYTSLGINSGFLRKNIASAASLPYNFRFPLSTNGTPSSVYTYADVTLISGKVTIGANAFIKVKPVTTEHPALQITNNALKKYWVIDQANLTIANQGVNLLFRYSQTEVTTNEGNYQVLQYTPSYPDGGAQWFVNPGASNQVVDINADLIYSEQVSTLKGDWTAGIEEAAIATYYSRADGNYNDPNTWSKLGFGGAASTTIPTNPSDRARIKDNTVTVVANANKVSNLSIEENSTIIFTGENYLAADSIIVKDEARLRITSAQGIDNGDTQGNLRSLKKSMSENVFYIYEGTDALQYSGNGLPAAVRTLILNKAIPSRILEMNDFVNIKDSLVINDGILDIGSYSINGANANRTLTMRGGELRIRSAYPVNYTANYFTAGLINFFGSGATSVPTNATTPSVLQYNKLELSGNRSGNITFPSNGQIKIADSLKISNLDFSSTTYKFLTSGSTVVFNKNGGDQYIPIKPNSPADSASYLYFHNLILDSTGNKNLKDTGTPLYVVKSNLTIRNQATFNSNGFNLSVEGNWVNQDAGSIFVPGTNTVLMNSPVTASTTNITSRDTTQNPFYNLVITGKGIVRPLDELKIRNNIRIDSSSTLLHQATNITLSGNWLNYKGTYTTNNANLYLNGLVLQTITKPNADETFDKLILRNANGVNISAIGTTTENGLNLNGDATLESGNIITGNRRVTTLANVVRPGATPGHINGTQWRSIPTGPSTTLYEVGTALSYTPVNFTVDSTAGSAGFIAVKADTLTGATSPITTGLLPANSLMSDPKNVRRQWTISKPTTSTFLLVDRTYTAQLNFVATNDLRNAADPNFFEARLWNGSAWVFPERLGNPYIGSRTASSIKFFKTKQFGTFITGEPSNFNFYSIVDGTWSTPASWSTERFGGAATTIEPTLDANVYIGDSKRISLTINKTNNKLVNIDSTGIINFTANNILQGTGEFRLNQFGKMEIGNAVGIMTAGATGSVQMTTRNYNYTNHNRGIFEYSGTLAQTIGTGLPANTFRLIMNKPSNTLTFNQTGKTILDSIYLKSGVFSYSSNFTIQGNLRRAAGVGFAYSGTPIIEFSGDSTQYINDEATDSLRLYSVRLNKNSRNLILEDNSPLDIVDQLNFQGSNNGIIYARKPGNYVIVRGTVNRTGLGHVNGELIKSIAAGDAPSVTFEVGDTLYYSPFYLDMRAGSGSTAGFLSMNVIAGDYPYMGDSPITQTNPPVYPGRIVRRFWRLTKPSWSTFVRGARNFDIRSEYRDPEDWDGLDSYRCADFAFNKDFDEISRNVTAWESIWPQNVDICSDTRDMTRTPRFVNTFGNGTAGNVYNDVDNITKPWGTTKTLSDNSLLLGDFVLGNQNGIAQFITFYSRQSGNWTDANTWSTVSHLSPINVADTISPTINFRKFPLRQYDNVVIDSGHTVTLDATIGIGEYNASGSPARYLAKVGPNVLVKPRGTIDLDIFELRGNSFKAEKGATIIVGSQDGINRMVSTSLSRGNLKSLALAIEDSVNFIYTAEGVTPENTYRVFPYTHNYCTIDMSNNSRYIQRVTVKQGATTIMNNNTGDSLINILSFHDYVAELTAGQTYTIEVERESNSGNRRLRVFIDWNRNGNWDATELIPTNNFNNKTLSTDFTVPATTPEGYTQMRVIYRDDNSNDPCANGTGEAEDYSIVVRNPLTNVAQVTGTLVPNVISSLTIRSPRPTSQVSLTNAHTIIDSLKFTSGVLNANGNNITLSGDIIADTLNPFSQGATTLSLFEGKNQNIRGTKPITLGAVTVNKDSNDVFIKTNTTFAGNTAVTSQTLIHVMDNDTLTFGNASTLTSGAGGFGLNRMIKVSGVPSLSGVIKKQFNNAPGNQSFTYPLGSGNLYNPGFVTINGAYTGIPELSVQLNNAKHPARLNDLILNKFWSVGQKNITSLNTSSFKFFYNIPADTNGNAPRYYAGLYRPTNEWEVNLGTNPSAYPDTIKATNTSFFVGDWTAGESSTYFKGRNYYSRLTGNWNLASNWSNVNHAGPPSSYAPGELSQSDTVFIDGHTIAFNIDTVTVDTITIGGAFGGASTAGRGILNFAAVPLDKHMTIQKSLFLASDGRVQSAVQLGKIDTLSIYERLINNGTAANTAGIDLHNSINDFVVLNFKGSTDSYLEGTGVWGGLSEVNLNKTGGLSDTLFINSATLGAASSSFVDYGFNLKSGVLKHYNNYDFVAGNDGIGINMDQFTGIVVTNGRLISNETVNTDVGNTIEIFGGEFIVGDQVDENFIYQDNTLVHLNGGKMTVAGAFDGDFLGATIRLNIENNSELKVLDKGATDIGLVGLNVNAGSTLDMATGRIIIANAIPGANADYKVNATLGTGFTGGVVQIGDSTSTLANSQIKVIGNSLGSTPIYDMHVVGNTISCLQTGASVNVANNLTIDNGATYNVSVNSLTVGGNITNYGLFDASNGNIADFRLLTLNGAGDQTIFNDDAPGMSLHNLTISKATGNVILSGSGNSNLQVHRNLEFATGNNAFINGSANQFASFVEVSPLGGTNPAIIRNGKGHVYGRLYRHFTSDATERLFVVGADTIDSYRPAQIKTVNNGNIAGLIGVAHYGKDHPDLDPGVMNTALNIQKYWNVNTNGFALASGNTYELNLDFLNPADIRNSANTNFFEQFMYDPACPAPPGACPPGTGTWTELPAITRTASSIRTRQVNFYGDVVVGEPSGITFYSIANGNWRLASSWSTAGYGGAAAARFPNLTSDIVRIGDNKRITMPDGILHDPVRAVIVEKYLGNPGELYILGNTGSVKASSFRIDDDCTLAFSNVGGITDNATQGAIQTNTKTFGVANLIFKAIGASMVSGKGFPDTLASVKVDLTDPLESVFTSNNVGLEPIKVRDSIIVDNGSYESGNRDFRLYGNFSQYANGLWKPLTGNFLVAGANAKTFRVGNAAGLSFYNLDVTGGDITFNLLPSGGANTHMYVGNTLNLIDTTLIKVRTDVRKVIVGNGGTVNRTGTGFVDGTMQRYFAAGVDTKQFAVGLDDIYTPVTVTTDNGAGGIAGGFDVIALEPVPNEPLWGNRLDLAKRIERFWKISKGDLNVALGARKFNTKFEFPSTELAAIDETKAVIRRETLLPATFPIWYQRQNTDLQWNTGIADVELSGTSLLWEDFGNFYIGEKPQRTFYSNSDGPWTDNGSWAMDIGGIILPPGGTYPNNDPTEMDDIVIIDDSDIINLDTIPQVAALTIKDNSTFIIGLGTYVGGSTPASTFDLTGGTIDNKSEFGIDTDDNISWTRFDNKTIDTDIEFIFSGTTDQIFGNEFPTTIASLTINNSGPPGDNTVAIGDNDYTITGDVVITDGDLRHSVDGNNLTLQGNLTTTEPLVLNEDINGNPICSDLTLQGSGATNQTIAGPGALTFCDLNMDRGAGAGIGILQTPATVTGTVNLLVGANPNPQIFELGNGGNLSVTNTNPNAMTGGSSGPVRYIRTSNTGGSLCRTVTTNGTYTWPVGSLEAGNDLYAPATLTTDATGTDGDICLKTNVGSNTNPAGAHNEVSSDASDYIARYWAINSATTTITGQLVFNYNVLDIRGTEADYDRIGNWSEPGEGTPGTWTTYNTGINLATNTFSTPATFNPADMIGDWTLAELIAFRRIFYSRMTGNWTNPNSWTANSTHIGPIFAAGVFPNIIQDSVVVGGGNAGVNDHVITLDVAGSVAIGGVALGTSSANTGTLLTGTNIITGDHFTMGELSTLGIGSADGISSLGNATGNIQASVVRTFATAPLRTSFIYEGTTNQITGNALPLNVENITVNNTGIPTSNTVTFQTSVAVEGNMRVQTGVADINTVTATSDGTGTMSIDAVAKLRISGTNNLLTSVNNYANYALDINSIVEFYGTAQTVSDLPANLVSGLGYCILNNAGVKTVSSPLLIRKDLTIINDANLNNLVGVNSLQVLGSIINDAEINNQGIIEIGQ